MKALVTRPVADAADLSAALGARGIAAVIEPLLQIRFLPDAGAILAPLLEGAQAVLFTSANGARAFAAATGKRDLPVFAVGDATAATARAAGFREVESAAGNVEDLARLVVGLLKPGDGALLHAAGSVTAGELGEILGAAHFELRRAVLYEALPAAQLTADTASALGKGEIDVALFFSPRTATTFVRLATAAGLGPACRSITAIALSPAVASALGGIAWREIATAAGPTEIELLAVLDRIAPRGEVEGSKSPMNEAPRPKEAAPPARAAAPSLPPVPRRARRGRFVPALLAILVVALGIAGSAPYWAPPLLQLLPWGPKQQAGGEETAALQARLAAAEQRIAALSQAPAPQAQGSAPQAQGPAPSPAQAPPAETPPAPPQAAAAPPSEETPLPAQGNQDRLAALALLSQMQGELRRLGQAVSELSARIDQSNARIDALAKQQSSGGESGNRMLLVALGELRGALETSRPFAAELATVAALGHDRPGLGAALGPLEAASRTGLPSTAMLAQEFSDHTAAAILRAATEESAADQDLGQRILAKLRALVVIRRLDSGEGGDPVERAVAAAEAALGQGDLAGAAKALDPLTGPAGAAARAWLAEAHQRLAAEAVLAKLSEGVAADLATGAGSATGSGGG